MSPVEPAVQAVAGGSAVVVVDDVGGTGGVVVTAGQRCDTATVAFLVRVSSGLVCVALPADRADRLRLPPMTHTSPAGGGPSFAVSVDVKRGVGTGISARDRAATVRALADPGTLPDDLVRPGHVLPVRVEPGRVLDRPGAAEAAYELCAAAGTAPAAVFAHVVDDAGELAGEEALAAFAHRHELALTRVSDVARWRRRQEPLVRPGVPGQGQPVPTAHGRFSAWTYGSGGECVALVRGDLTADRPALVHVHEECLAGDVLGSRRCGCAARLDAALAAIADAGRGVLLYLRGGSPEQSDVGHARSRLARRPGAAAVVSDVLDDLGVRRAVLLTDDPVEAACLRSRVAVGTRPLQAGSFGAAAEAG